MPSLHNIYIVAGHSTNPKKDRGAISGEYVEGVEAWLLTKNFVDIFDFITDDQNNVLRDTINYFFNRTKSNDLLIEIHFNASNNPKATGTECIVQTDYNDLEFSIATMLCAVTSRKLGIKNRGVKSEDKTPRKRLGLFRIPTNTIIWEVCFLTNETDMESFIKNKIGLVTQIGNELEVYRHYNIETDNE